MLTYLEETSLFDSPAQTLVNTVNTVGVMGKGIAAEFKMRYPQMYKEYRDLCLRAKLDVGKLHVYRTPNKIIVNFPTKKHWRERSRIEYVEKGLQKFTKYYMEYGITSASFPQLGCGNGELDWSSQVQPLIEKHLAGLTIPVYVHLYPLPAGFRPERLDPDYEKEVLKERQQISFNKLWNDLATVISHNEIAASEPTLFSPKASSTDEQFLVTLSSGDVAHIHRDNIENLWNTLLITGTISIKDISNELLYNELSDWLIQALSKLPYVKPVRLRLKSSLLPICGLRYEPLPLAEIDRRASSEIVI